eukprot:7437738-Pyramimonas_sp.AAC.1
MRVYCVSGILGRGAARPKRDGCGYGSPASKGQVLIRVQCASGFPGKDARNSKLQRMWIRVLPAQAATATSRIHVGATLD